MLAGNTVCRVPEGRFRRLPQRTSIASHHEGRRFILRIAHQQIAAVTHGDYQHGLGTRHAWPDTAFYAGWRSLTVARGHRDGSCLCPLVRLPSASDPLPSLSRMDGAQRRGAARPGRTFGVSVESPAHSPALGPGRSQVARDHRQKSEIGAVRAQKWCSDGSDVCVRCD